MPANVDALIKEGIAALKGGNRTEAKQALMKAVEINQQSEQAWLWLSAVSDTVDQRELCLENVLTLNPANEKARKGLEETRKEKAAKPVQSAFNDPFSLPFGGAAGADFGNSGGAFAGTSFDSNPYANPAGGAATPNDPALSGWSGFDTGSSSVDWGTPPSAPVRAANEPSPQEYDNWVAGLSIGGSSDGTPVPAFGDDFGSVESFSGDDSFGGAVDPFASPSNSGFGGFDGGYQDSYAPDPYAAPQASAPLNDSAFGGFDFSAPVSPAEDPFGMSNEGGDPFNFGKSTGGGGGKSSFEFGNTDFFNPTPVAPSNSFSDDAYAPPTIPVVSDFDTLSDFDAPNFDDDLIPTTSAQLNEFAFDAPAPRLTGNAGGRTKPAVTSIPPPPSNASVFTTIESTPSLANPSAYFQQIPEEIQLTGAKKAKATSAKTARSASSPDTTTHSAPDRRLLLTVAALLLVNIGSILFLLFNLGR